MPASSLLSLRWGLELVWLALVWSAGSVWANEATTTSDQQPIAEASQPEETVPPEEAAPPDETVPANAEGETSVPESKSPTAESPLADSSEEMATPTEGSEEAPPEKQPETPSGAAGEPKTGETAEPPATESVEEESPREVEEATEQPPAADLKSPDPSRKKRVIGATAVVLEKKSGYLFKSRVDTGAKSCSLHIEQLVIEGEAPNMADNVGKMASFKVKNGSGETQWIKSKIATYVRVKKDDIFEHRYKVPLVLRWKDYEKKVLVTLNDRSQMTYPMLIGRNFLHGEFVVDVTVASDD